MNKFQPMIIRSAVSARPPRAQSFLAPALLLSGIGLALCLGGCQNVGQNRYAAREVGRASEVAFGTVVAAREVDIKGANSGFGAAAGAAAGGIAGSQFGNGGGNAAATLAGVLIGGLAGAAAEQSASDRRGVEYTVTLANGKTIVLAQEMNKEDRIFCPGERVMVQTDGLYQRVLAADYLPTEIDRPQKIKVKD